MFTLNTSFDLIFTSARGNHNFGYSHFARIPTYLWLAHAHLSKENLFANLACVPSQRPLDHIFEPTERLELESAIAIQQRFPYSDERFNEDTLLWDLSTISPPHNQGSYRWQVHGKQLALDSWSSPNRWTQVLMLDPAGLRGFNREYLAFVRAQTGTLEGQIEKVETILGTLKKIEIR